MFREKRTSTPYSDRTPYPRPMPHSAPETHHAHLYGFPTLAARNFAYVSPIVQTAVSAMREIGKDNITENEITRIRNLCSSVNKETFESDLKLAPEWISRLLTERVEHAD